uniref:hypothetical protein n=1 Tax=Phocaeicola coprocola TaxID=310298 RepID=UPI0026DD0666
AMSLFFNILYLFLYRTHVNLHNAINKLATDIANINNLTKEEQETIYEVLEGTINHKNIEK